jgi:hypothetical protein
MSRIYNAPRAEVFQVDCSSSRALIVAKLKRQLLRLPQAEYRLLGQASVHAMAPRLGGVDEASNLAMTAKVSIGDNCFAAALMAATVSCSAER